MLPWPLPPLWLLLPSVTVDTGGPPGAGFLSLKGTPPVVTGAPKGAIAGSPAGGGTPAVGPAISDFVQ